jgi:di/tricarboxylate transporter
VLGGRRLSGRVEVSEEAAPAAAALSGAQRLTLVVILGWIVGVVVLGLNLGLSAFAASVILIGVRAAEEAPALRGVPWGVIVMVTGVSVLIGLLDATGGMEMFTTLLSRLASPDTIYGVMAFVTGAISTYSSTSGVVLPTFLPTVPGVIENLGGGNPLALSLSINVGASLVDVSPLSTLGALCVAAVADGAEGRRLFRQLLIWGVSMTLVGALLSQFLAVPLARL